MIDGILYKRAWRTLAMVFGEQENTEALKIMDAVLHGVYLEMHSEREQFKEEANATKNKKTT